MSNTITAYFKGRIGVAEAVYQNDYGIVLAFDSIDLPAHFDCYFSAPGSDTSKAAVGADNRVVIPNEVLALTGTMTVHIPMHTGENDSEVEYVAYFKVIGRARPEDDGTPAQMTAIERALALLQTPIGNIEEIVNEALSFTGETFEEMQAALDADQEAFKEEVRGDIADVESDFDVLNAQYQTAVSALTVDSEVQNIRVGDNGIIYTSAGEAVRSQFSDVKDNIDLLSEETDLIAVGDVADNTTILTAYDVSEGDIVYYDFEAKTGFTGYIAIYDSESHVAQEIGKGSSSSTINHYSGTITIGSDFHHIVAKATATGETSSLFFNRFSTKWRGETSDLLKWAYAGTAKSFDSSNSVSVSSEDFINCRFDNLSALTKPTYKIIKDPNNIICPFIRVAKGDKVHVEPGGLYARVHYFTDIYSFSDYQTNFSDEESTFTCVGDGFVSVMLRKNADASTAIAPSDFDTNEASIIIDHEAAAKLDDTIAVIARNQDYYKQTQIKNRTVTFDDFTYLAFSGGAFYNRKEIHVCRAGMAHETPEDSSDWGKLLFMIIDEDGSKEYKYLDRPDAFNYELRDPNLVVTRENKLILSGFGIRVVDENNLTGSYMLMLSIDDENNISIVDSLYNYVPSGECVWGNTIEDANGYLYKCTYGADSDTTIKIYKSTTTLGSSNTLPDTYELFASYQSEEEITETTISIYKDEYLFAIARREASAPMLLVFDFGGQLNKAIALGGADGNTLHAPVLLPYYATPHMIYSASQKNQDNYRHPIVGVFDFDTGRVISSRYVLYTPSYGGYTSLVPIGQNCYGVTYYIDIHSAVDSGFYYMRINAERFLNWNWV